MRSAASTRARCASRSDQDSDDGTTLARAATERLLCNPAVVEVVDVSTQRGDRARDRRPPLRLTGRHCGE